MTYNLSVARELLKQVYIAERLQPPLNPQAWTDAYTTLAQRARNLDYWREILRNGEWAKVGLYAIEAYTIFKVSSGCGLYRRFALYDGNAKLLHVPLFALWYLFHCHSSLVFLFRLAK